MKILLDDEAPVPFEMLCRYLSNSPNSYVFGILDICRAQNPTEDILPNTYGQDQIVDENATSNLILLFPRVDLTKREGETDLTGQMQEAINNAQNQNDGKVVIPDDLAYLNGIILDNRLQLEIVNPNYKLQLVSGSD